jgi:hypothetical protein
MTTIVDAPRFRTAPAATAPELPVSVLEEYAARLRRELASVEQMLRTAAPTANRVPPETLAG